MPGREACGRRPSRRRHHALNRQKARIAGLVHHKIKKYCDQSRYVYENKQNSDKMPGERLDIYIKVTRFLQKIAGFDRHLHGMVLSPRVGCRNSRQTWERPLAVNGLTVDMPYVRSRSSATIRRHGVQEQD
jgi:hypothetical protein